MTFLLVNGRISMIQLDAPATNQTRSGVGIGSTEQQVRRTYGGTPREQERAVHGSPEPGEDPGVLLLLPPKGVGSTLLFEVAEGKVLSIRTGSRSQVIAGYGEGCTVS